MILTACIATSFYFAQISPVRVEIVTPIRNSSFDKGGSAKERRQGGNPVSLNDILTFDGSMDGNRQVDPQIAVGGGFVLHGTNSGIVIYDKKGGYVRGVPQKEFNDGIDPKMYFDVNNKSFVFDLWVYWDKEKVKPVNVSVSETSDPRGAWNTYPVSASKGVDGGAIGGSRKWIGYSFPGGTEQTFVIRLADAKAGKPAKVFHFAGSLGHPVTTQDKTDDLYFMNLTDTDIEIRRVSDAGDGTPVLASVVRKPHGFKHFGWPPQAPMKGVTVRTSSGDRNPKNIVLQSGCLWFSQTVDVNGRAGVQWHQVRLNGQFIQSGLISHPVNSYIQTTLAVDKAGDVLVGFQETGPEMFISARYALHKHSDKSGALAPIMKTREGTAATEGGAWGDYSGSCVDGDDMKSLWTIQSYANEKGRASTVITKINPGR
jgi:hypothetical protein